MISIGNFTLVCKSSGTNYYFLFHSTELIWKINHATKSNLNNLLFVCDDFCVHLLKQYNLFFVYTTDLSVNNPTIVGINISYFQRYNFEWAKNASFVHWFPWWRFLAGLPNLWFSNSIGATFRQFKMQLLSDILIISFPFIKYAQTQ